MQYAPATLTMSGGQGRRADTAAPLLGALPLSVSVRGCGMTVAGKLTTASAR